MRDNDALRHAAEMVNVVRVGYILKPESKGFADGLNVSCQSNRGFKDNSKDFELNNSKTRIAIN